MARDRHEKSWVERSQGTAEDIVPTDDITAYVKRRAFHQPHTALGVIGHWIGLAGTMAPIVIGEFITDPAKRWRAVRLAAVGTAVAYETLHTVRELERRREEKTKLDDCEQRAGAHGAGR